MTNKYLALATANNQFSNFKIRPKRLRWVSKVVLAILLCASISLFPLAHNVSVVLATPAPFTTWYPYNDDSTAVSGTASWKLTENTVDSGSDSTTNVTLTAISFPSYQRGSVLTGTMTITKPTGLANGDYLLFLANRDDNVASFTLPTNFQLWAQKLEGTGTDSTMVAAYKKITDVSGEPASYDFVPAGDLAEEAVGVLLIVRGADQTTFADVTYVEASHYVYHDNAVPNPASITTTTNNAVVVIFAGTSLDVDPVVSGSSPPQNYSVLGPGYDLAGTGALDSQLLLAYRAIASAGAEDAGAWTGLSDTTSNDWHSIVLAIRPVITASRAYYYSPGATNSGNNVNASTCSTLSYTSGNGRGWIWDTPFQAGGYISSGTWTFYIYESDNGSTGVGTIITCVWKVTLTGSQINAGGTLLVEATSADDLWNGGVSNITYTALGQSQKDFSAGDYIYVEYWNYITTVPAAGTTSSFYTGDITGNDPSIVTPNVQIPEKAIFLVAAAPFIPMMVLWLRRKRKALLANYET